MKKAALFKGALVAPSSLTFGMEAGRGAGSRKGTGDDSPGWKLIVVAAVGVVCRVVVVRVTAISDRRGARAGYFPF